MIAIATVLRIEALHRHGSLAEALRLVARALDAGHRPPPCEAGEVATLLRRELAARALGRAGGAALRRLDDAALAALHARCDAVGLRVLRVTAED